MKDWIMNIWDGVTVVCIMVVCISVVSVFDMNNHNKLAVAAIEAGLQECLAVGSGARIGQTVWLKECSK